MFFRWTANVVKVWVWLVRSIITCRRARRSTLTATSAFCMPSVSTCKLRYLAPPYLDYADVLVPMAARVMALGRDPWEQQAESARAKATLDGHDKSRRALQSSLKYKTVAEIETAIRQMEVRQVRHPCCPAVFQSTPLFQTRT